MANNRMYLLCNVCNKKFDSMPPKRAFMLGKWYPRGGYAMQNEHYATLGDFIEEHSHDGMEYPLRIEYEVEQEIEGADN